MCTSQGGKLRVRLQMGQVSSMASNVSPSMKKVPICTNSLLGRISSSVKRLRCVARPPNVRDTSLCDRQQHNSSICEATAQAFTESALSGKCQRFEHGAHQNQIQMSGHTDGDSQHCVHNGTLERETVVTHRGSCRNLCSTLA